MEYTKRGHLIPQSVLPRHLEYYWDVFWRIRGFAGADENPLTPDMIAQWERHDYCRFERWEREVFFAMDKALRHASVEVLKFHMNRPKVDLSDSDKSRIK